MLGCIKRGVASRAREVGPTPVLNTTQQLSTTAPFPLLLPQVRRQGRDLEIKQFLFWLMSSKTKGKQYQKCTDTYSQHNHPPATKQHSTSTTVPHSPLCIMSGGTKSPLASIKQPSSRCAPITQQHPNSRVLSALNTISVETRTSPMIFTVKG